MKDLFDLLLRRMGSHAAVARALGYTGRQYRNIRKKVEDDEKLHPRVEMFIIVKSQLIQGNSINLFKPSLATGGDAAPASGMRS
ncbi:hypothetical protein [Solidesulfovibrio sp. C21]|uniref:hypothetical protein n=1 Tax=Solidesulfovibrio sp. C21 TaxID=3398613 RepID=UPI0039FC862C